LSLSAFRDVSGVELFISSPFGLPVEDTELALEAFSALDESGVGKPTSGDSRRGLGVRQRWRR
jgi:hypothetical protein